MHHDTPADKERDLQERAERLVRQEVNVCLSSLVSTLAKSHCVVGIDRGQWVSAAKEAAADLFALQEQAFELCSPKLDYEEAATQAGWSHHVSRLAGNPHFKKDGDSTVYQFDGWQDLCESEGIEPYEEWEIFEHWSVSRWLGELLAAKGERVDMDFANLVVWGRSTTGQGIAMDSVIREITRELHKA